VLNLVFFIKWLGHASFQITFNNKIIYIDPYEGSYTSKADLILISHSHHDHCNTLKLEKALKEDTIIGAPSECRTLISRKITVLKTGKTLKIDNIAIGVVHAYNTKRFRSPGTPFHPKGSGLGFLITLDGKTVYYAGDTDLISEMEDLQNIYLALLPCGGTYTMDIPEAIEAALVINPKVVIPMHRLNSDPKELKKQLEKKSYIKVILPQPGETQKIE
jgi:L-ascorbate metabolism protein UlaG (beta-lactamase superfamily)